MKKSKFKQVLYAMGKYIKEVLVVFGAFTLLDFFFFEKVINNEVILQNIFTSPFLALLFIIMKEVQKEDETETTGSRLSSVKE